MSEKAPPEFPAALDLVTRHKPRLKTQASRIKAAVCVILRNTDQGIEFLLMQRADHPNDPWSGQMAFPGGKVEKTDAGPKEAAMREAFEEVGIRLSEQQYVGQLNDLYGFKLDGVYVAHIASFVFLLDEPVSIKHNYEVADTVWLPLEYLEDPNNFMVYENPRVNLLDIRDMPAIRINLDKGQILWGLSMRILLLLYDVLERPMTVLDEATIKILRELEANEH